MNKVVLSPEEIEKFSAWIVQNVTSQVVPPDENDEAGLLFGLLSLVKGKPERYDYKFEQDDQMFKWAHQYATDEQKKDWDPPVGFPPEPHFRQQ